MPGRVEVRHLHWIHYPNVWADRGKGHWMRIETLNGDESGRPLGAIVVTNDSPDVLIDAGPADGLPLLRVRLTRAEALALSANLRAVANGRDEELLLADD